MKKTVSPKKLTLPQFGCSSGAGSHGFVEVEKYGQGPQLGWVFEGDNLEVLPILLGQLGEAFDLVYVDPPFCTGNLYPRQTLLKDDGQKQDILKIPAYSDKWEGGLEEYLGWLRPRISQAHRLLKPEGSFVIHLDWRVAPYVRVLLDQIFGAEKLRNQIIWYKGFRGTCARKIFQRSHDVLLWYTKGDDWYWAQDYEPYRDQELKRYNRTDERGRRYALIKRRRTDGTIYYGKTYPNPRGKRRNDVIADVPTMAATASERTGYATQKPVRLLEILVRSLSPPEGLVGDFFCGTGSCLRAAKRHGRSFVGIDQSPLAIHLTRLGLLKEDFEGSFSIFRQKKCLPSPSLVPWAKRKKDGGVVLNLPGELQAKLEWWAVGEAKLPFSACWFSMRKSKVPATLSCTTQAIEDSERPLWVVLGLCDGTQKWGLVP